MTAPRLLLLAGLSCSGKTGLGRALQRSLTPETWLFWETDRSAPRFPPVYHDLRMDDADRVKEALAHQLQLVRAELTAIASYVESGFKMIVERFLWDEEHLAVASEILGPYAPLVIELRCELSTLEQREEERGTTYVGFARQQGEGGGWTVPADLVLDSESRSVDELCEAVIAWLNVNPTPRGLAPKAI